MLVLLVNAAGPIVDDARPLEDGSPPPTLTFDGPAVEGAGGHLVPGDDVVYRLTGRADLVGAYGRDIVESPLAPASHLAELRALPVYVLEPAVSPAAAGVHPSGARPHLRLAPPVEVPTPAALLRDGEVPHFDLSGFAAALKVPGALVEGMRIRLSGFHDPALDGLYDVGEVTGPVDGSYSAGLSPVGRPAETAVVSSGAAAAAVAHVTIEGP